MLKTLVEKYREGHKKVRVAFFLSGSKEELWYCVRESEVAEKYVSVVQDMYESNMTVVR